jgi:hypothetical protein
MEQVKGAGGPLSVLLAVELLAGDGLDEPVDAEDLAVAAGVVAGLSRASRSGSAWACWVGRVRRMWAWVSSRWR